MISRYEAVLNGVSLSSISADILIHDISYSAPVFQDDTYSVAKRQGSRILKRDFESASVSISFEIHAYDVRNRQAICNAVCAWAKNGGVLKTNDREGQFLQCVCSQFPSVESARNWTDPLIVSFTAYAYPFWQEVNYSTLALSAGTSGSGTLWVPGSTNDALVEAEVKANASLSSVSLTVKGRTLSLTGLSVASGSTIVISYDTDGIQSIKAGSTSLLDKRSGVDDLLANCGESNSMSFSSSASVNVTFKVRGIWV